MARILRYAASLEFASIAGALAGAALVLAHLVEDEYLFGTYATLRWAAVGWLAGFAVAFAIGRAVRHLRGQSTAPVARWRRALLIVITLLAFLAVLPWLRVTLSGGLQIIARKTGIVSGSTHPNLILITIDALRADHLGAYGNPSGLTPNLDAFARESTLYEAAYVSSPWTLPSFGAIFTGRPPSACGLKTDAPELTEWYVKEAVLPEGVPLLSEALREAGYTTAAIITNPFLSTPRGLSRGFDHFLNENEAEKAIPASFQTGRASTVTRKAGVWLALNWKDPFFLWVHYLDPHVPYDSPDTPETLRNKYPKNWKTFRSYWYETMSDRPSAEKARYAEFCREMYAEEVRYVDRWVGSLLKELRRFGRYDNSLVVITSDHGEELFDHGGFEHGHSMHEEVLRVPLLIKWPKGWGSDKRIRQTVALMDLAPTFLEAADARQMKGMWGGQLTRRDGAPGSEVYSEGMLYGKEQMAFTTDDYKVIYYPFREEGDAEFAVFDRQRDRSEHTDLAEKGAATELQNRLKAGAGEAQTTARRWTESGTAGFELTETEKRRLRSLGYLGGN